MKKILILVGLATMLAAAECPEKNQMYSIGYNGMTERLAEYNNDPEVIKSNIIRISAGTRTWCETKCLLIAYDDNTPLEKAAKKEQMCLDLCKKGSNDGFNGSKPKMKLCP
jgi:hypothetical protein